MAITNEMLDRKVEQVIRDQKNAFLKKALEQGAQQVTDIVRESARARGEGRVYARAANRDNNVVDNRQLPHMPQGSVVVLSDNVYRKLNEISNKTNQQHVEVPFFLTGHSEGNTVVFDDCITGAQDNLNGTSASFADLSSQFIGFIKKAKKSEHKVIAHGHSHPHADNSGFYLNYSMGDIDAYIDMHYDISNLKDNVDLLGCLITGGNYNFVFFDGNDTYRFDNVFVQGRDGQFTHKLPCFGPDVASAQRTHNTGRSL